MDPSCFSDRKGALYPEPLHSLRAVPHWFLNLTHQPLGYTGTQMFRCPAFKGTVQRDGRPILCSFDSVTVQA
jgi:hypothetical protein